MNSRPQANNSLCKVDSCHWCKIKQSDFKTSHWLCCAGLCHSYVLGMQDIVITGRNEVAVGSVESGQLR